MLNIFSNNNNNNNNKKENGVVARYHDGQAYTINQTSFLQEDMMFLRKYIHRTRNLDDAFSIMENGLVVEDSLEACVDEVARSHKEINTNNVFNFRFGNYSLIIGLPKNTEHIDSYLVYPELINSSVINDIIDEDDFDDPVVLDSKYIAGIANQITGEIIRNPNYVSNKLITSETNDEVNLSAVDYSNNSANNSYSKEAS